MVKLPPAVLGARDPADAARVEVVEVGEVHAGFVEDDDLALIKCGADLAGAPVVVLPGGVHDGVGGQEAFEAQAKLHLRCGLALAVLGLVQAVGHQFHDCGTTTGR
jgi:hypothetical protein